LNDGVFEVLATNGNTRLGGDDIDTALMSEFGFQSSGLTAEQTARLREEMVHAKHRLSAQGKAVVDIPFFQGATAFHLELSREELEKIARPIIERTQLHCRRALADARISASDLEQVILVGGVTRMPLVRRYVAEIFGQEPNISDNPEEAVAIGATIQAGILSGTIQDVVLLDVTPLSLGIETFGGLMNVIIPRNSTIPTRAGEMFTTAVHNQRSMAIKVLQGEREMARDNWLLGEFEIDFEPAPKGVPRVGVQFEIDTNGILHVLARDTKTGKEKRIEMKSAVDVSDEAVESMLAESLDHAFTDVSERIWTETKLKSEEMLSAVDSALSLAGDRIEEVEKNRILELARGVRQRIDSHEAQKLKEANEALDAATQHLAAVVVEKAMSSHGSPTPAG
jgi:molecular chaperone DnaK